MTSTSQLDYLDQIAVDVAHGDLRRLGPLSTGERCYVCLAASRSDLLAEDGNTIAEALERIGTEWTNELLTRWRYSGNPANIRQNYDDVEAFQRP